MKLVTKLLMLAALIAGFAFAAAPVYAQSSTRTKTITEQQINASYRFTNPVRRSVMSKSADLQPGQMVFTVKTTYRDGKSFTTEATLVPRLEDGRLYWTVTAVVVDGTAPSQDVIDQINARIQSSWINFVKSRAGSGRIISIEITDSEIKLVTEVRQ